MRQPAIGRRWRRAHVAGEPWDLGTATRNGLFPRSSAQTRLLTAFGGSSKIAAWCDANDVGLVVAHHRV